MLSVSCCWIVQALSDDAKYCKKNGDDIMAVTTVKCVKLKTNLKS